MFLQHSGTTASSAERRPGGKETVFVMGGFVTQCSGAHFRWVYVWIVCSAFEGSAEMCPWPWARIGPGWKEGRPWLFSLWTCTCPVGGSIQTRQWCKCTGQTGWWQSRRWSAAPGAGAMPCILTTILAETAAEDNFSVVRFNVSSFFFFLPASVHMNR